MSDADDTSSFYAEIAARYDEVTGADRRREAARAFVAHLVRRYKIRSAIDVACGSGLYTVPLAELGVQTVGVDLSGDMLAAARRRAEHARVAPGWLQASMERLDRRVSGPYDALLCMGNSLPHLLTPRQLSAALRAFAAVLAPGGLAAFSLLNYTPILDGRDRIVGITRRGERQYVRFYDFLRRRVRFNVLQIDWQDGAARHKLSSTLLRPYGSAEVTEALRRSGFERIERYGDLALSPFREESSDVLVVLARRPSLGS